MLLQKFPKTVSYTVIVAVIPKPMQTRQVEVGGWDQYSTQWKSEEEDGLYPDNKDEGRLLF